MLSKQASRKKGIGASGNGKFLGDLETMSNALYPEKPLSRLASSTASSRSKSVLKLPETKKEPDGRTKASSEKDKKSSIWSWKGLKALTNARNRLFDCRFSLSVHSIEGLPAFLNDACLVVHWKRRDIERSTKPVRVFRGVARIEEQLTHSCSVYGSRSGSHHSAKYEAQHSVMYVSVYSSPELDLGKHRVDLTRLLPLKMEEIEESGKWTTSFRLSGRARGATINVSFGYVVIENNVSDFVNSQQSSERTIEMNSVPSGGPSSATCQMAEDLKDLHEVLPMPKSELCDSVSILYQKLDEEMCCTLAENEVMADPSLPSMVDSHKVEFFTPPDAGGEHNCESDNENENEMNEFSVVDKGIVELDQENSKPEDESLETDQHQGSGVEDDKQPENNCQNHENPENEMYSKGSPPDAGGEHNCESENENDMNDFSVVDKGIVELDQENSKQEDESLENDRHQGSGVEDEDAFPRASDVPENNCQSYENSENEIYSKESLMKELEAALTCTSELVNELDFQEDETDGINTENYTEGVESDYKDPRKGKSISLDDDTEIVAQDFLEMLGMEGNNSLSSESEPESPRERLLREFEKDSLMNGGLLNFDFEYDPAEFDNDFQDSSMFEDFSETSRIEDDEDAFVTNNNKTRASRLEDLETEALMREWGFNEKAFQHSPSSSDRFESPIHVNPDDDYPQQLPPLAEGLGPFVQTKNGGFMRSMNPALFTNAKIGGSLIMQVSNPVVVPAEMGSGVMGILQGLASVGIEKLSMQANKLMPLEDVTGKTIQQIAWEGGVHNLDGPEREDLLPEESRTLPNIYSKHVPNNSSKSNASLLNSDPEYVSLEDLAPLAMDKIEALSIEGLRIHSGMSDEKDAPSNISTQSIGEFSALKGKAADVGGSLGLDGTCGLQLMDIKENGGEEGVDDGLMGLGLSLTLDEWMKLDSGEIGEDELVSERTSKILAAHHATSLDVFRGRSKGDKKRGRGKKYGLLGNNFTVALMVQLRDPLRDYEAVGAPMLALVQVERVFVPPKPRIYGTVSMVRDYSKEDEKENVVEKLKDDDEIIREEEVSVIPQYKITEVRVAGLKTEDGKKKLWGSASHQQSGSRWLLANGMGKKSDGKNSLLKSKTAVGKSSGGSLWSITGKRR